jgi:hypothetical protein
MRRWVPSLRLLLAAVADVGAALPLIVLAGRLLPVQPDGPTFHLPLPGGGLSPLIFLLVWLGAWAISAKARGGMTALSLLLLAGATVLVWAGLPRGGRPTTPLDPLFIISLLPALIALWWGGAKIGGNGLSWATAFDGLRRSIAVCLGGLFLLAFGGQVGLAVIAAPLILFGSGLALLYLLRVGEEGVTRIGTAAALAPLLLVALLAFVVSPAAVGAVLAAIGHALSLVVELFAVPIGYLVVLMTRFIQFLFALQPKVQQQPAAEGCQPSPTNPCLPQEQPGAVADMGFVKPYVSALLLIGLALLLLYLTRRLWKRDRLGEAEEDLDEVRSSPGLLKGLLQDLRSLFANRIGPQVALSLAPGDPRWLLRRLQAWGAQQGRSRRPAETPAQYAEALGRQLPEGANPAGMDALTAAYSDSRYGSGAPNPGQVAGAEALLGRLEQPPKHS